MKRRRAARTEKTLTAVGKRKSRRMDSGVDDETITWHYRLASCPPERQTGTIPPLDSRPKWDVVFWCACVYVCVQGGHWGPWTAARSRSLCQTVHAHAAPLGGVQAVVRGEGTKKKISIIQVYNESPGCSATTSGDGGSRSRG